MRKNASNQYTQRTVPGTAQVRGFADADAEVTVNGTWRSGEYFYGGDDADNASFPVFQELAIEAASPEDEVTAVTGRVFVAQSPETFTYDADGNMLTDGRFRYTWNAENRLVRAQELCAPPDESIIQHSYHIYFENSNLKYSNEISQSIDVVYFTASAASSCYRRDQCL